MEAALFQDDPLMQRLVSILYYLQVEAGDNSFWISTRDCGKVLGVSHSKAAEWLSVLASRHYAIIKVVKVHTTEAAPRLRYVNFPQAID